MKNKLLSVLVENNYGVVARIAGLFTRRGFNMNSFTGERTHKENVSRITISITEEEQAIEQIKKQVEKLVDIKKVKILEEDKTIIRELALIKVCTCDELLRCIKKLTVDYQVRVVDMDTQVVVFEICHTKEMIDAFMQSVASYGILESVRTGVIALETGNQHM